jgi:hypothetical protein
VTGFGSNVRFFLRKQNGEGLCILEFTCIVIHVQSNIINRKLCSI